MQIETDHSAQSFTLSSVALLIMVAEMIADEEASVSLLAIVGIQLRETLLVSDRLQEHAWSLQQRAAACKIQRAFRRQSAP